MRNILYSAVAALALSGCATSGTLDLLHNAQASCAANGTDCDRVQIWQRAAEEERSENTAAVLTGVLAGLVAAAAVVATTPAPSTTVVVFH